MRTALALLYEKPIYQKANTIYLVIIGLRMKNDSFLNIRLPELYQPDPVHKFHDRINRVELEPSGSEVGVVGAFVVIVLEQFAKHKEVKRS